MMFRRIKRRRFLIIAAAGAGFGAAVLGGRLADAKASPPLREWRGTSLGAAARILLYHDSAAEADRLIAAALAEIARLERVFSLYRPDSALSTLNRDGELREPPFDFLRLMAASKSYSALTGGAFDVTVQPLWRLYESHFAREGADPAGPKREAIEGALGLVGDRDLVVEPGRIAFGRPGMAATLNGIAQGYITDRVADLLKANGLAHVLVDLDELRALGPRADASPWRVAIADPERPGRAVSTVELADGAMGTSGGYGTQFDAAGRFNHIFDPATGGCAGRYLSVSVTAPLGETADALSTAFSVMPQSRIRACLAALPGLRAILMGKDRALAAYGA
jgi:thiamine biosynthesis lipoprotein